jgi:two-component system OmpR family response regulator
MRFPATLALVDGDVGYSSSLAEHLRELGIQVRHFGDSSDLIAEPDAFGFEFYAFDLALAGVDGVEMIRILRRRTNAGIVVVSDRLPSEVFDSVIIAGADMYLAKPIRFGQIALAIQAVHRRIARAAETQAQWKLDRRAGQLIAPDGKRVELSGTDVAVLECFAGAAGATVSREALRATLGGPPTEQPDNLLHATIYRLRRRIERVTSTRVPLQSQPRVGYVFRAPLRLV